MRSIITIIRLTLLEAVRRRIAIASLILGIGFLILFSIGFHYIHRDVMESPRGARAAIVQSQVSNFFGTAALYAVNFLTIAMGALLSADTLAGEITSGTIQTLASKPLARVQIVLGKWIGFAILLLLYLLLLAGGVMLSVYLQSGYAMRHIAAGLSLMYLESILIMTLSLACSSTFSTLATGGIVFGLYGLSFIGGWVEQLGAAFKNQTAINVGIISSFLVPAEALWKRASYEFTSAILRSIEFGAGPFSALSVPNQWTVVYSVFYTLVILTVASYRFHVRDL
jgi:ABC-type transport system involved in multi-copper enzyme maturation permease subunit